MVRFRVFMCIFNKNYIKENWFLRRLSYLYSTLNNLMNTFSFVIMFTVKSVSSPGSNVETTNVYGICCAFNSGISTE